MRPAPRGILRRLCLILAAAWAPFAPMHAQLQNETVSLAPMIRLPPSRHAPVVDGSLAPGEWDGAFTGVGVARHGSGGLDPIHVDYGFTYDAENIYLFARMETPPGVDLGQRPRRLARSAEDYHFEFLVDPYACDADRNWVQTMVYPGGHYKNLGYSQRIGGYVPYDVAWTVRDGWREGWWTVELSAPAAAFQQADLADGRVWGVLHAGLISTGPYYFSGTVGEAFAKRSRFLKVVLDRGAPVVQVAAIGDPRRRVEPRVVVRNTTDQARDFTIRWQVARTTPARFSQVLDAAGPPESASTQRIAVASGAQGEAKWDVVPPEDNSFSRWLQIAVSDTASGIDVFKTVYRIDRARETKWTRAEPPPPVPVMMEAHFYPSFDRVRAVVDFGGVPNPAAVAEVRLAVRDRDGRIVAQGVAQPDASASAEAQLPLPTKRQLGEYRVEAELFSAAKDRLGAASDTYVEQTFGFEKNRLGIADRVLYPWTPIVLGSRGGDAPIEASVWNRTYTLGAGALPEQVVSDGRALLAGPIAFIERSDGRVTRLTGAHPVVTRHADPAFEASATLTGRHTRAAIRLLGEYDGMLKYEVEISGVKGARLDGLDLVIPIHPDHARFLHAAGDGCRSNYSHELRPGTGTVWNSTAVVNWSMPSTWLTYAWLGDHERGLCWWADSAEGWTLPAERQAPVVEIVRRGDRMELVLKIVARPATVLWRDETPRRLVFAFEATPMRPRPAWARDIGLCDLSATRQNGPRFEWVGNTYWAFYGKEREFDPASGRYTFAYRRPIDADAEAALRVATARAETNGRHMLIYTDMRCVALVGDLEKQYATEWNPEMEDHRKSVLASAPQHAAVRVNATRSRIEYDLWCFNRLMDLGVRYFYFDEIQNEGQINPAAGLGYQDEAGRWMPTMRLFAYRELWKRLYTMMQERGQREPVIVMHNTSTTYAGPMAFCTATWDFEEANTDPRQRQLTRYGLDYLLTEATGRPYGFAASTLGPSRSFERWVTTDAEERAIARHWMGVHMLLDMNPYLTSHAVVRQGLELLGAFGWNRPDCQYVPFWLAEKEGRWSLAPAQGLYSAIYRRGSAFLLILLNDTPEALDGVWKPGPRMRVRALRPAADGGDALRPEGGGYRVKVPGFDYVALLGEADWVK